MTRQDSLRDLRAEGTDAGLEWPREQLEKEWKAEESPRAPRTSSLGSDSPPLSRAVNLLEPGGSRWVQGGEVRKHGDRTPGWLL